MQNWTVIIDNGSEEIVKTFEKEEDARSAWREADHKVRDKEWFSADLRNPSGKRMSYVEQ